MKSKYTVIAFTKNGPETIYSGPSITEAKAAYATADLGMVNRMDGTFAADGSMLKGVRYENTILARKTGYPAHDLNPSFA